MISLEKSVSTWQFPVNKAIKFGPCGEAAPTCLWDSRIDSWHYRISWWTKYKNNGSYCRRSLPLSPLSHFSPSPSPSLFAPATQATQLRANENGINNIDLQLIDRHQSISTKWHQSGAPFASVRSFPKNNDIGQAFVFSPPPTPPPFPSIALAPTLRVTMFTLPNLPPS